MLDKMFPYMEDFRACSTVTEFLSVDFPVPSSMKGLAECFPHFLHL